MGRRAQVSRLEAKIKRPERRGPFDWEAAYGEIGVVARDCINLFLTNAALSPGHAHQLMLMGGFAMNNLTGHRTILNGERESIRQLMADPDYRGFGWTEAKHPKATELYRMCEARAWLDSGDRAARLESHVLPGD